MPQMNYLRYTSECTAFVAVSAISYCYVLLRFILKSLLTFVPCISGKVAEHKASINLSHDKLGLTAEAGLLNSEVMVSDTISDRIFCGKVQCRPGVKRFTKHGVEFVDGKVVDNLDAVVFATGYELQFEFIDNSIIQGKSYL